MDPILRLLPSDGEPYRLADDDFFKLAAWLAHRPPVSLREYQTRREEALQRDERVRQLKRLLTYNELLRQQPSPPAASPHSSTATRRDVDQSERARPSEIASAELTDEVSSEPELMFVDDGFFYGGTKVPLTGKQLEFLRAIARSHFRTLSRQAALATIWRDANCQPRAVNQTVHELRKCLRKVYGAEAIEHSGHGDTLAWKLVMPFRLAGTEGSDSARSDIA